LLVDGPTSRKRGQHVAAIVNHHIWENAKLTKEVIGAVTSGIEENIFDEVRPLFRIFTSLLNIKDSLQKDRIEWSMSALLATMKQQDRYYKITELCIEHLIRIAKKNGEVYVWLRDHADRWSWLIEWIGQYPNQPGHMDQSVAMYKPGKGGHHVSMWSMARGYNFSNGLNGKAKKTVLELIAQGKDIDTNDASDSDEDLSERVFQLNQKVDCRDTASKWLISTVIGIKDGQVQIHYDGWSARWDEWMDTDIPRIAKLHRYTAPPPPAVEVVNGGNVTVAQAVGGGGNAASAAEMEGVPSGSSSMAVVLHSNPQDPAPDP